MASPATPTFTGISFNFKNAYSTYRLDFNAPVDILSSRGYALLCNGIDPNTKIDVDTGQSDLLMRAPNYELNPFITTAPSGLGKIYGNDYKWRFRYRNSQTGETSGMSYLPTVGLNMGVSWTVSGTTYFMGQTAYFYIPGTALSGVDTVELLRNLSSDESEWFVVTKGSNPGSGSTVLLTDNIGDEDLWNMEQASLYPGPSYEVPHPPPCARAFEHSSTGRVWLYGHYPMGVHTSGSASTASIGTNAVVGSSCFFSRIREGQKLRFTVDPNRQTFRIVEYTGSNTYQVTPAALSVLSGTYQIDDDRDARNIYMLSPISPAQWEPTDVLTIGSDKSDGVRGVFMLGSNTFVLTRKRLYALENDQSDDPVGSVRIRLVAEVGCAGFWAHCVTPFGAVFVDERKGVMLFDGNYPVPLGRDSPFKDFELETQFAAMDHGYISETVCKYDPDTKRVFVSYCPSGVGVLSEQFSFDPAALNWRGPWRRLVNSAGTMYDTNGKQRYILGDIFGVLALENSGTFDNATSPASGTILTVTTPNILIATATIADYYTGAFILFNDGAGNYYPNFLVYGGNASANLILLFLPTTPIQVGWTFQIGYIHWQAKTAFLNLGDPGTPKHIHDLAVGYERISSAENFVVQASPEGLSMAESADATSSSDGLITGGLVKSTAALNVGFTALTLRLSGRSARGGPKITNLVANMAIYSGNQDPTEGNKKKVTIRTTATS